MTYDHYDLLNWLQPWPIAFRGRRKWKLYFLSMSQAKRLKSCWKEDGKRYSMATVHKRIHKGWLRKHHHICSLARSSSVENKPVIVVVKGVVWDGNHTLLALIERGYNGPVLVAEPIGKAQSKHMWKPKGE